MTYIINPWIFYLMHICNGITITSVLGIGITGAIGLVCGISSECTYDEEENDRYIGYLKKSIILFMISVLMLIFVPNKETIEKMIVASFVTKENISYTKEEVTEFIDHIIEKVQDKQEKKE